MMKKIFKGGFLRDNPEKAMHLYYGICLGIWLIYNLVTSGSPGLPLIILAGGNLIYVTILKKKEET
ncbi:hypothetical protein MOD53_09425 [Bacillus spizizenii]|uniref:hypothetical protein n=1 Tax=Bacillus spizizenii TaxID=96241 RepID=UPI0005C9B701|nr:hypothetical protein [Bacillus spizizenii]MCY7831061.1 hypothetical protein [Bacillus spizizenii]MCY8683673.1 hypothetical protein [Bacillus spizizenii]MCY9117640.1 hypothetical protein [Bacillus spizizenii]MEC1594895.1 hypothetical protein [Bacillus spizizenii]